jgi:toxin YoeB
VEIIYSDEAQQDITFWRKSGNKIIQKKIQQLIAAIEENPFEGIGKPEPLKHNLSGLWSRRINQEHRIIYELIDGAGTLKIISLKGHYEK